VVDIYTDCDDNEDERDMYADVLYFRGSYDRYEYEYWKSQFEDFFNYFELTTEEKCRYARLRLDLEAY